MTSPPDPALHIQALLDALPWQAVVLDSDGVIRRTNAPWRAVTRREGVDDVGVNYLDICDEAAGAEPEAGEASQGIRAVLAGTRDRYEVEYPCHSPDAPHWFVLVVTPVEHEGQRVGALVTHQEITARRESEHDLRAFVAQAAHDLRSPLRHLSSFPELLESDLGPQLQGAQRRWLTAIRHAADHMRTQLDNLLALARSRLEPLEFSAVDLAGLVTERFERQRPILDVEGTLDVSRAESIVTAPMLLTVLVDNVITNSLRHARGAESLVIRVTTTPEADGHQLWFDDNGPGFGDVNVDRLLRPYERGPRSSSGLGLGLSIVKQVALRLGGTLRLGHSPGGGARIAVWLPTREAGPETARIEPDTVEIRRFGRG